MPKLFIMVTGAYNDLSALSSDLPFGLCEHGVMVLSTKGVKSWLVNNAPKQIFMALWWFTNIFLFIYYFHFYNTKTKYYYLRQIIGAGLPWARASAACLNFNCMLILLCVCRNMLSVIHNSRFCPRMIRRLINHNIALHKACAWMIVFNTVVHTLAHLYNVEFIYSYYKTQSSITGVASYLEDIPQKSSLYDGMLDKIMTPSDSQLTVLFGSVGGLTGILLDVILFLMVTSSMEIIRRSYFEVFWYTHHLFILFYLLIIGHGMGKMIKAQTNADDPSFKDETDFKMCTDVTGSVCPVPPEFGTSYKPNAGTTWCWVIVPMVIYMIERLIRFSGRFNPATVYKVVKHPSNVLELRMRKKGWKSEAGQYVFLQCSQLSYFEWHPFTLTSAPEEDYLSVHIRQIGDWTRGLGGIIGKNIKATRKEGKNTELRFSMAVDGPFGTPSEDIFRYKVAICIGAGIGVTPYASILKSIWYKLKSGNKHFGLKRMIFYWLCPDTNCFEWFVAELKSVDEKLAAIEALDFLEYKIYLTRGWSKNEAENIMMHEGDKDDVITGLRYPTNYGRPEWVKEFTNIGNQHRDMDIGIFFCGPAILSEALNAGSNIANKNLAKAGNGAKLYYNKENF